LLLRVLHDQVDVGLGLIDSLPDLVTGLHRDSLYRPLGLGGARVCNASICAE
jgi:hypothetical protein